MKDTPKGLDEILDYIDLNSGSDWHLREEVRAKAKQAINEYVLGIIGEDETHWTDHFGHESNVPTDGMNARNELRKEQRKRMEL